MVQTLVCVEVSLERALDLVRVHRCVDLCDGLHGPLWIELRDSVHCVRDTTHRDLIPDGSPGAEDAVDLAIPVLLGIVDDPVPGHFACSRAVRAELERIVSL